MKVIASSLRKGNIVEIDGKLYVVLTAESFHPGKGTPTTQVDMRRISDGVKVSQRYKTTEQVERAFVEDREHQFLYQDGDGFHFMNTENYDQITLQADIVGDQAAYLAAGDEGDAEPARGRRRCRSNCRRRSILEVVETEPTIKSQTAASSYKPAVLSNGVRTMVPPFVGDRHQDRGDDGGRLLRGAGEGLSVVLSGPHKVAAFTGTSLAGDGARLSRMHCEPTAYGRRRVGVVREGIAGAHLPG